MSLRPDLPITLGISGKHIMNKMASIPLIRSLLLATAWFLCGLAFLSATLPAIADPLPKLVIILDSSSSMEDQLAGELKYKLVRKAMSRVLFPYRGKLETGLVAFGRRTTNTCNDVDHVVPLSPLQPTGFLQRLDEILPAGKSPIGTALLDAASLAEKIKGPLHMLVIADGGDNCRKDLCTTARMIARHAPKIRIHVIGLGRTASVERLNCLSESTGGTFTATAGLDEMTATLNQVLYTVAMKKPKPVWKRKKRKWSFSALFAKPPLPVRRAPHRLAEYRQPEEQKEPSTQPLPPVAERKPDPLPYAIESIVREAEPETRRKVPAYLVRPVDKPEIRKETPETAPVIRQAEAAGAPLITGAIPEKTQRASTPTPFLDNRPDSKQVALPKTSAPVRLGALISEQGQQIRNGLIWRIYESKKNAEGRYKLVRSLKAPNFEDNLPVGVYLVNLSWGRSHLTEKIDILSSKPFRRNFVLNAGGLRLSARHMNGTKLPAQQVTYSVYTDERDQFGKRKLLIDHAPAAKIIRLNAGIYHITSRFGAANGLVDTDITVEAGKLTDVVINHTASKVTFKLVNQPGGEALAGAKWRISSPDGKLIREVGGALPTVILAAGDYTVNAEYSGRIFARKITIEPGDPVHVEIVIQ